MDIEIKEGRIVDGDYPNALERIAGAFSESHAPIWVTSRPGVEFAIEETLIHARGSHGSLYRDDSEAGLLVTAGVALERLSNPAKPRIVDVLQLCLQHFGINHATVKSTELSRQLSEV